MAGEIGVSDDEKAKMQADVEKLESGDDIIVENWEIGQDPYGHRTFLMDGDGRLTPVEPVHDPDRTGPTRPAHRRPRRRTCHDGPPLHCLMRRPQRCRHG
jgi:hypothetical protein